MAKNNLATESVKPPRLAAWLRLFLKTLFNRHQPLRVSDEYLVQNPFVVLSILYYGTMLFLLLLIGLLLVSWLGLGNSYVSSRIVIGLGLFLYVALGFWQLRAGRERVAAYVLLFLYGFIATLGVVLWSISVPFGLLMFGFVIVLAGITLGPRYTVRTAALVILILLITQLGVEAGWLAPDRSRLVAPPGLGDVANFGTAFLIIALVSWLSGRQLQGSLRRALRAEAALQKEKEALATRLADRTRKLRAAQLQEMQQLYRFAELGQLSTALLHDLANHLTVLTLDIEDLNKKRHSSAITRAKQSIFYLDKMVEQVRAQLQESSHSRRFTLRSQIEETFAQLKTKAQKYHIQLELAGNAKALAVKCTGDPMRFRQIMTILVSNAIDAYKAQPKVASSATNRRIVVEIKLKKQTVHINIRDWGVGIPPNERKKLFKPFYSTKVDGMGIGLFIARQMLETHFKGNITLNPAVDFTEFNLKLDASV